MCVQPWVTACAGVRQNMYAVADAAARLRWAVHICVTGLVACIWRLHGPGFGDSMFYPFMHSVRLVRYERTWVV